MVKVGLVGLGGMGRVHFDCYGKNPDAEIVALCDIDESKLSGDWGSVGLNLGTIENKSADLSNVRRYTDYREFVADPDIDIIDICLPTDLHARVAIEALHAGKHVLCEKPMAFDSGQCWAMEQALHKAGDRQLMIAHCLRYWPQYVKAHEIIKSRQYGRVLYARFTRSGATPAWSSEDWLRKPERSGGAVLDMHVHDVDTALWWFGKPRHIHATGLNIDHLPLFVDAHWSYENGPVVFIHGSWDNNGGGFRYGFHVVMENASLVCDSLVDSAALRLVQNGEETVIDTESKSAYQAEIDDFVDCIKEGRKLTRVTPDDGRLAVETVREELKQIASHT